MNADQFAPTRKGRFHRHAYLGKRVDELLHSLAALAVRVAVTPDVAAFLELEQFMLFSKRELSFGSVRKLAAAPSVRSVTFEEMHAPESA